MLALLALALAFRLPQLGNRPFHADEAVHAVKFQELRETGRYVYDPNEFHGPTIYYAALPIVWASGHRTFGDLTEADLRCAVALFGAGLAPLLLLVRRKIPDGALLWGGLFFALSPALVFYSRYFIQEVFLVGFTLLFLAFALNAPQPPVTGERKSPHYGGKGGTILAGLLAGLMLATKETAALTFLATAVAWFVARGGAKNLPWKALGTGALAAILAAYVVLSGFFTNLGGPLGYFQTYAPWLKRAGGAELHVQPWADYFERYFWHAIPQRPLWTEGFALLLGVLGAIFSRKTDYGRFLSVFTLALFLGYSAIPYKTPWCGLNFLAPLLLLAGIGAAGAIERVRPVWGKALVILSLLAGVVHYGWLSYQTSFVYFGDAKNPYVHSPSLPELEPLRLRLEEVAKGHPQGTNLTVKVFARDGYYWPLPWYLRNFPNVGFWTATLPPDPSAPIILASPKFETALTEKLPKHRLLGMHGLRLGVFYDLFVEEKLWDDYRKRVPPRDDEEF